MPRPSTGESVGADFIPMLGDKSTSETQTKKAPERVISGVGRVLSQLLPTRAEPSRRLESRVAHLEQAVSALREVTPRGRDDYGFVFVVTYRRSGSTLLQGLLNAIDGYQIRGENGGVTYDLYRYWSAAARLHERHGHARTPHHAWYGIDKYDPEMARRSVRDLVVSTLLRPDRGTRVTGFKEVRWWNESFEDYAVWMRDTFPGAKFIINTRDHQSVAESKMWNRMDHNAALERLNDWEKVLNRIEELLEGSTYRVHYDEYVSNPDVLQDMYEWLGEQWFPNRVRAVLHQKHSF